MLTGPVGPLVLPVLIGQSVSNNYREAVMDPLNILDQCQQRVIVVLQHLTPGHYADQSPCAEWDVKTCANKLVLSNQRFVEGLASGTFDFAMSHPPDLIGDANPVDVYRDVATQCAASFRAAGALAAAYTTPLGETPGDMLLGVRIFDDTAITWDLAVATGVEHGIEDEQATMALEVAKVIVPAMEGAPDYQRFDQATQVDVAASPLEQMLAVSGRDVHWTRA